MDLSVTIDVTKGPRITSIRGITGEELTAQLSPPVTIGPAAGPRTDLHGGHRVWVAPEVPELTYACDEGPGMLHASEGHVTALDGGRPVARRLDVSVVGSTVHVRHVLTNTGDQPLRMTPWAVTQLRPGGIACLPVGRHSPDEHGLQASGAVVAWPYTRLDDPRIDFTHRTVTIDAAGMTPMSAPIKVGTDGTEPWMAYAVGQSVMIVRSQPRPASADFVDLGAILQSYACHRFVELEAVGALTDVSPGEHRILEQEWSVHRRTWNRGEPVLSHLLELVRATTPPPTSTPPSESA